jgi:exopolysaccharide production protein ExoQ
MNGTVAALVCAVLIAGLFALNRQRNVRTSAALWLPVCWLLVVGSRPVSAWLGMAPPDTAGQYLDGSPIDRNVSSVLIFLGVMVLAGRRRTVLKLLRNNVPILLFVLYCAVSVAWSDYPDVAFKRWVKSLGDYVMILVVVTDRNPLSALKRVIARVGFVLIPFSIELIRYSPLGRYYSRFEGKQYFGGVTLNKNELGMVCLLLGVGTAWRLLQEYQGRGDAQRGRRLLAHGALLTMALWLLWKVNSMTSIACFLMAVPLMVVGSVPALARKRAKVHLLVIAVLLVAFSVLFLHVGSDILSTVGRDATLTGRTDIWDLALLLAGNPLVGTGYESYWLGKRLDTFWRLVWWHPQEAHNGYLEMFLQLGWVGVGLLATLIATGYRNVISRLRRDPSTAGLMLAYFVVALAYNFTEAAFKSLHPVWIFFVLAIVAVPKSAVPPKPGAEPENREREAETATGTPVWGGVPEMTGTGGSFIYYIY